MTVATDSPFTAEELEPTLRPLLEASLLPARAYTDEAVAEWEARNFFLGGWICVGHVSAFAGRGDFVTAEISGESLLFVGDKGFYNVCRHRGSRLVTEREGTKRRLQCPYHAWSYGFDGTLKNAPHTDELDGLRPGLQRPAGDPHGDARRPRVRRRVRPGAAARRPRRRARRAPGRLPQRRPQARRPDRLRRQGELEGGRRELLRVPALPGRAPGAQPAQQLHDRARLRGRGRLVRRLDDAQRRRRDDDDQQRRPHRGR